MGQYLVQKWFNIQCNSTGLVQIALANEARQGRAFTAWPLHKAYGLTSESSLGYQFQKAKKWIAAKSGWEPVREYPSLPGINACQGINT